ncbi:hypothetical protein [Sphingobacterium sp. LRF_L2]|uniref:hypothetical protein n=1 Tax=Sphingobacterium sp. LRF_L2 TaxID=3369421 RepID=UPI003F5E39B3
MKRKKMLFVLAAALLLGSGAYALSGEDVKENTPKATLADQNWVFTQAVSSDPMNPENYAEGSTTHCTGVLNLCGIKAPADENGNPIIEPNSPLAQRIQNKDTSQGDVFLRND